MTDDDFFENSTREGERILGVANLGEDQGAMLALFARHSPGKRESVLYNLDNRLDGEFALSETRKVARLKHFRSRALNIHLRLKHQGK
jgi:hypothetical protein